MTTSYPGVLAAPVLALVLLFAPHAGAQEMTPRAYWPAPQGTEVLTLGASYTKGDSVPDPSLPVTGIDSEISQFTVGYLRTFGLWGRTANLILQQSYASGTTSGDSEELGRLKRDYQGFGDFAATLSVNLMGAPVMDHEGFAALRRDPHPILAASLRVVAPTGRYQEERLINVGANRWAARAEIGYMVPLSPKWLAEIDLGVWVFDDNDDFLEDMKREQDPIYATQLHLVRRFSPGFWLSLDANGYSGGRSRIDGQKLEDLQRDTRLGATLVFPFARKHAIKVSYTMGSVNDADESFDIYQLSYQRLL